MIEKLDIKLIKDERNNFDIGIGSDGDLLATDGFDTSILLSLGTDARASESEVQDSIKRRGYVGDEFFDNENFNHGSKLWLLEQARVTNDTRNSAVNYAELALQWFVDENYLDSVTASGLLSPTQITISIKGITREGNTESFSYQVWNNTLGNL